MAEPEIMEGEIIGAESTALAVDLARADIDVQIATARKYPRRLTKVRNDLLSYVTLDDETAEECMFALPRGGTPITGPSIRFAEALASSFGNCRSGARVIYVDRAEKVVIAEGFFQDLETNRGSRTEVRRRISGKGGRIYNDDMIAMTGNAAAAIAHRNAILGGIPKPVWRAAYAAVKQLIAGDITTLAESRKKAIAALAVYGATPEMIFAALEVGGELDITLDHIPVLRGFFASIKNGEATAEEVFGRRGGTGDKEAGVADPLKDEAPGSISEAIAKRADEVTGPVLAAQAKKTAAKKAKAEPVPSTAQSAGPQAQTTTDAKSAVPALTADLNAVSAAMEAEVTKDTGAANLPKQASAGEGAAPPLSPPPIAAKAASEAPSGPAVAVWTKADYQKLSKYLMRAEGGVSLTKQWDAFFRDNLTFMADGVSRAIRDAHVGRVRDGDTLEVMDRTIADVLKGVA